MNLIKWVQFFIIPIQFSHIPNLYEFSKMFHKFKTKGEMKRVNEREIKFRNFLFNSIFLFFKSKHLIFFFIFTVYEFIFNSPEEKLYSFTEISRSLCLRKIIYLSRKVFGFLKDLNKIECYVKCKIDKKFLSNTYFVSKNIFLFYFLLLISLEKKKINDLH